MKEIEKVFGIIIKKLRTSQKISQVEFAAKVGIDRVYYSSIENGKHSISIDKICLIANGLNITLSNLFKLVEDYHE